MVRLVRKFANDYSRNSSAMKKKDERKTATRVTEWVPAMLDWYRQLAMGNSLHSAHIVLQMSAVEYERRSFLLQPVVPD